MAKLLVLNLGSTSTKVALFDDETLIKQHTLRHSQADLAPFKTILDQKEFRQSVLETWLIQEGIQFSELDLLVARGGILKPMPGGIYQINPAVVRDAEKESYGSHVSNVGLLIAASWQNEHAKEAIFVDAPSTDEMQAVARLTGVKGIHRRSAFHALNQKQVAKHYAQSIHKAYKDINLVVAHLGGGITIGAHHKGQVIDVTNGLDGEGPMSPERSGELPNFRVLDATTHHTIEDLKRMWSGKAGLVSHFNTSDVAQLVERSNQDPEVRLVIEAMVYQIAKHIGSMATVLKGDVQQILLTGGLAYNTQLCSMIVARIAWIAPVTIYPGEDELKALALGGLRYLRQEETLKVYE